MARMYRVLAFISLLVALLALWGGLMGMSVLFFVQAGVFLALGLIELSERTYLTIFMAYLFFAFTGFMFYAFFGDYPKTLDEHVGTALLAWSSCKT